MSKMCKYRVVFIPKHCPENSWYSCILWDTHEEADAYAKNICIDHADSQLYLIVPTRD